MNAVSMARTAARAGLLRPLRPDRYLSAARSYAAYGTTLAGACGSAAALYGPDPAIIDASGIITFGQLHARTNALAHALINRGIAAGQYVGLCARNHGAFVEAAIALSKLGAHAVLLNTSMAGAQLIDIITREAIVAVIADDEFIDALRPIGHQVLLISTDETRHWSEIHTTSALPRPVDAGRTVILTSGTTGIPKGARRGSPASSTTATGILDVIPYRRGEAMLIAAPLFHAWGFAHLAIAFALGAPIVLQPRFDGLAATAAIARFRVGVLVAVPIMLRRMLEVPEALHADHNTTSLRIVPLSGSAIPAGLAEAFMDRFGEVVYNLYGSTEVGSASIATPDDLRRAPGTAGRPPAGVSIRILDEQDNEISGVGSGRIFVCSDLAFDGYTNGDSKTVVHGYMSTGDIGHIDADGRLFIDGRDDDMIVSGGENVYPREVEDLLALHPAILEAAVIGVDDDEFGQRLHAFVVSAGPTTNATTNATTSAMTTAITSGMPHETLDTAAVQAYVRDHLARYKVPRAVTFVDALPRNATGKVLKRELR